MNLTTLDVCLVDKLTKLGLTLILMDVEGSEMLALKRALKLIENCSPDLILEINDELLREAGSSANELLQYLREYDYEVYWIDERGELLGVGKNNELPHIAILPPHTGANYLFVKKNVTWVKKFLRSEKVLLKIHSLLQFLCINNSQELKPTVAWAGIEPAT